MADLEIWQDGFIGRFRLNRPTALNALTHGMVLEMTRQLLAWREDGSITLVLVDAVGEKAFCAGGDIAFLYGLKGDDISPAQTFWADEYRLNHLIATYPKPFIPLMDGFAMGGGVGVSCHGSHRIVTEHARIAMPECAIGFLPDVGGSWLLKRAPGQCGLYLGMTGARMDAADAIYAGFADHYIRRVDLDDFVRSLRDGESLVVALKRLANDPGQSVLANNQSDIDAAFTAENPAAVEVALDAASRKSSFAAAMLKSLRRNSPSAMVAAWLVQTEAQIESLVDALAVEYRYSYRALQRDEFFEGVRAAVIDKDRNPQWQPSTLAEVDLSAVRAWFAPLDGFELELDPTDSAKKEHAYETLR